MVDEDLKMVHQQVRYQFHQRKDPEVFLVKKMDSEINEFLQCDILQILGNLRSTHALNMARLFLGSNNDLKRETALFVLGWTGGEQEISLLAKHMMEELLPHLRITAASAHRQIAWRCPELKQTVIESLAKGFLHEVDDRVVKWIIVMMGTVSVKNLGLREDKQDPNVLHGDLEKAKVKARKFVESLTPK